MMKKSQEFFYFLFHIIYYFILNIKYVAQENYKDEKKD